MNLGLMTLGDHLPDPHTGRFHFDHASRHRNFVEQAVQAEALGFHSVHLGEHHFSDYILASPAVVLAAIAERTTRLRLSTAVTLATHHDPLQLAEDYATVDNLSNGRVDVVMGRGGFTRAYEVFGQDYAESRAIYAEAVTLFQKVWREEKVSFEAKYRAPLVEVTVMPRPVQKRPPMWIAAGSSEESFDLAADLGVDLMLPTIFGPAESFVPLANRFKERFAAAGHDVQRPQLGTCVHTFVTRDSQNARETWFPYYDNYLRWVGGVLSSQKFGGPGIDFRAENFIDGPAMCGSPAEVIDKIGALREVLDMDLHLAMFDAGGLPEASMRESIELFGTEVIPAFG